MILGDLVSIETEDGEKAIPGPATAARYVKYTRLLLHVSVTGRETAALCRRVAAGTR